MFVSSSCCASTDHRHSINHASVSQSIHKLKGGINDGFDGLTSNFILNGTALLALSTFIYFIFAHVVPLYCSYI